MDCVGEGESFVTYGQLSHAWRFGLITSYTLHNIQVTLVDSTRSTLIGASLADLEDMMTQMGEPRFRAQQLHSWIYVHCVRNFEAMTNLSKAFRQKLFESFQVGQLSIADKQVSNDGTCKYLFRLPDDHVVESVLMYFEERDVYSVCLSTQVGCAVNCDFCATGKLGFKRQLTTAEIVEQLLYVIHDSKTDVRNIVFMGQGEPLLNYDNTIEAIGLINRSAEIGMRHITLSTSGIVPGIERLADEDLQLTLAVSLHAPDNETRNQIMPINRKYPLEVLIPVLRDYFDRTHRRITIEYVMLADVNDSEAHAYNLIALLKGLNCNVNLIPYNPIGEEYGYKRPSRERIARFRDIVFDKGNVKTTVRVERGVDIAAACGQLANTIHKSAEPVLTPA